MLGRDSADWSHFAELGVPWGDVTDGRKKLRYTELVAKVGESRWGLN